MAAGHQTGRLKRSGRHAVLILAHAQPDLLQLLLDAIDFASNDIFVHIDSRSPLRGARLHVARSRLFTLNGRVAWGGYSMVSAEFRLLRAAVRTDDYDYLHLISGQDLPLVTPEQMHDRLAGRREQFIGRTPARDVDADWKLRYWHPFADNRRYRRSPILKAGRRAAQATQWMAGVDRVTPMNLRPRHGSQWFSITGDFGLWLLERQAWVQRAFSHAITADEILLPTMWASLDPPFELSDEKDQNLRWINWDPVREPGPRTITSHDLTQLAERAPYCLFARKFDLAVEPAAARAALTLAGR